MNTINRIINILILFSISVFMIGCSNPVDMSKAEITFTHTVTLPGGFSVVSSVPLNLTQLNLLREQTAPKLQDGEQFSIYVTVRNDNARHNNTIIVLNYEPASVEYLYLYDEVGEPLEMRKHNLYAFDKDVLPGATTRLYVVGKTKPIVTNNPYVGVDIRVTYADSGGTVLTTQLKTLEVNKANYNLPIQSS